MANFANFADDAIRFAKGFNHALRPNSSKAALKTAKEMGKLSDDAIKNMLNHGAGKNGMKTAEAMLKGGPTSGIASTIHHMDGGKGFKEAMKIAHSKNVYNEAGAVVGTRTSKAKVAGTVFTAGVAGRVATGGGLYRDRYGNINVPGVPFI